MAQQEIFENSRLELPMKQSQWCHIYQRDHEYAVLNSFSLDVLYLDEEAYHVLTKFRFPVLPKVVLNEYKYADACLRVLRSFIKAGLIVPESTDEIAELQNLRRHLFSQQLRPRRTSTVRLILTERCNGRCKYCFVLRDPRRPPDDLKFSDIAKFLGWFFKHNTDHAVSIQFFGGEPLLCWDIIKKTLSLISEMSAKHRIAKTHLSLVTNGLLLTRDTVKVLAKHEVDVGLSIDGWKEIHDSYRRDSSGEGTFDVVTSKIALFHELHLPLSVNITPTSGNLEVFREVCKFIYQDLGIPAIFVNTPIIMPGGKRGVDVKLCAQKIFDGKIVAEQYGEQYLSIAERFIRGLDHKVPQIQDCILADDTFSVNLVPGGQVSLCNLEWGEDQFLIPIDDFIRDDGCRPSRRLKPLYPNESCLSCPAMNLCGGPCLLERTRISDPNRDPERCAFYRECVSRAVWYKEFN